MLLHGWGASGELMMPIAKSLKGYRFIVPDFYGFGNSRHPDYPLNLSDYAYGVVDILKKEEINRAIFICHSFGGRVGIYLSKETPELVEKLVLCNSAGILPRKSIKYYIKLWIYRIRKKLGLDVSKCGSKEYRELNSVMKKTFVNVVNFDQSDSLRYIDCPTLIVWGKRDKTTPIYMAKKLNKNIANSQLVVFDRAGHFSYADELGKFIFVVKRFLEG
ncbi:MAG: alpha/beta hydrolase [Clostridia bacterium]|nr:alpha/beta hydrolase [Clostridia bacterium]